jgi:hypothetical protein
MKYLVVFIVLIILSFSAEANKTSEYLESISPSEQASILLKVINHEKHRCDKLTRTFLQGYERDDAAYWNVSCGNGHSYNIQVQPSKSLVTRVADCELMKKAGVECFKKLGK